MLPKVYLTFLEICPGQANRPSHADVQVSDAVLVTALAESALVGVLKAASGTSPSAEISRSGSRRVL